MLDFTIKMLFSYIFGEGIIDVFNDKKVVWQKCVSARVTQTSRNYLIFDLTVVLSLYFPIQVGQEIEKRRSVETINKVLANVLKLILKSLQ